MNFAIIIPVYGQHHFTEAVLDDLWEDEQVRKGVHQIYIVDNKGDWEQRHNEVVLRPGENLRWTKGTNFGLAEAQSFNTYDAYICMNNDVRLSDGFLWGVERTLRDMPLIDLLGPLYDDVWEHQRPAYGRISAREFEPSPGAHEVPFIDGTCMIIPRKTLYYVGLLDEEHFGEYGWGADFDYGYRVRQKGGTVMVTHRSYLNHLHQGTAKTQSSNWNGLAGNEMEAGMQAKYGPDWRQELGVV